MNKPLLLSLVSVFLLANRPALSDDLCSRERTHFDTNHRLTVIWDPGNPGEAAQRLKATIRATLPDEAQLEDE